MQNKKELDSNPNVKILTIEDKDYFLLKIPEKFDIL